MRAGQPTPTAVGTAGPNPQRAGDATAGSAETPDVAEGEQDEKGEPQRAQEEGKEEGEKGVPGAEEGGEEEGSESREGTGEETGEVEQVGVVEGEPEGEVVEEGAESGAGGTARGTETAGGVELENFTLPPVTQPRLGIDTPYVASPPRAVVERSEEIRKRTGTTPEQHHAHVRQAVLRVVEAARQAQRHVVWGIERLALDTRVSIEELVDEIPRIVAGAIAHIDKAVSQAKDQIRKSADDQVKRIRDHRVQIGANLAKNRDDVMVHVHEELLKNSKQLRKANGALQESFRERLEEAQAKVKAVPQTGRAELISAGEGGGKTGQTPAGAGGREGGEASGVRTLKEAATLLISKLMNANGKMPLGRFQNVRCAEAVPGMVQARQSVLQQGADGRAEQLGSDATRAQFAIVSLGLVAPVERAEATDEEGEANRVQREVNQENRRAQSASERARQSLLDKRDGVCRYLEKNIQSPVKKNLRKAGQQMAQGFRQQALVAQQALQSSAAPMAETYRDLVKRLAPLIPPGRFLDWGALRPRLEGALRSASQLREGQLKVVRSQAALTLEQAQDAQRTQIASLWKIVTKTDQSISEVIVRTNFDFELAASQFTGKLGAGADRTIAQAKAYAERVAGNLLETNAKVEKGLSPLDQMAIGFLNNAIRTEHNIYLDSVGKLETDFEAPGGAFQGYRQAVLEDLEKRADKVHNALPGRSTAGVVASAVFGLVGAGVYLYMTDADEDDVLVAIGDLPWPGPPALEQVFASKRYGNLRSRINDRMDDPERKQALALFSASAERRGKARLEVAEASTRIFGPSDASREAVLRGMSAEERTIVREKGWLEQTRRHLREELRGSELTIGEAYLDGNAAAALAARIRQRLDRARRKGDDAIVQSVDEIQNLARQELGGTYNNAFVTPDQVQKLTDQAFREFAVQTGPPGRKAEDVSVEEARSKFVAYATADREVQVHHGRHAPPQTIHVAVDQRVKSSVEAAITHGADSEEAWTARAAYEIDRADRGWGGLSETTQMRLTRALEDQKYYRIKREFENADPERQAELAPQMAEAERAHEGRMKGLAKQLGATEDDFKAAGGASKWMADRVGTLFAREDTEDAVYGRELVERGRASLVAGVRLSTRGVGTHEDLLRHTYLGRSKDEIEQARKEWKEKASEWGEESDLDVMLGLKERERGAGDYLLMGLSPVGYMISRGGEVSGDLAHELEILSLGEPETDLDHARIAALRYDQQRRRGTGVLAEHSMSGTPQQRTLDARRRELGEHILKAAKARGGPAAGKLGNDPLAVFTPEGQIRKEFAKLAFDENGSLRGGRTDRTHLLDLTHGLRLATDSYKAEIDRQESFFSSIITALAIAVSIVLLFIPGVNVVAAGVLTALIAGSATMAVKLGMRGGRYGWEEAATDVAMMGVEAATAGVGGALAGGLGKAGMAGKLAGVGERLAARFGKVGAAVIREAMTNAASSAAQVAMQDDTWRDGMGTGLTQVLGGGAKGAAVGAVTAGVSEGLEGRLARALDPGMTDSARLNGLQRLGKTLGPRGSEVLREAVSESVGSIAGESVGVMADVMSDQHRGGLKEALMRIGQAGLRDMVSGAGRAAVLGRNRARYRHLLVEARSRTDLTDSDLRALRLAGISAGVTSYGEGLGRIRSEVEAGRDVLAALPPSLRSQAEGLDQGTLAQLRTMLETGDLGTRADRLDLMRSIREQVPEIDARTFLRELGAANSTLRDAEARAQQERRYRDKQVRNQLVSKLEGPVRRSMRDVPLDGLDRLPEAELQRAADMVARGDFDPEAATALLRAAKAEDPEVDAFNFLRNLADAVETARLGREAERALRAKRRQDVLETVPEAARSLFADLPDDAIAQVKRLLDQESAGSAHQRDALYRAARRVAPDLDQRRFDGFLEAGVSRVQERREAARSVRRETRKKRLAHLPEELRGPLSALPDDALFELRVLAAEGAPLSPATRQRLLDAAVRETPDADKLALADALTAAVARGRPDREVSEREDAKLRAELISAVPRDQRHRLEEVTILVVRADDFETFTRSQKGQAVTLIVHGRPVVVLKEGADPTVLREEGLHVLQSKDPTWSKRVGALDERSMADWDRLPLEEQLALYRNKVAIEIDAQQRLLASLEPHRTRALDPADAAKLRQQVERAQAALDNLLRRQAEVRGITEVQKRAMEAGVVTRPDWLNQPARLFGKDSRRGRPEGEPERAPAEERADLEAQLRESIPRDRRRDVLDAARNLDADTLRTIVELPLRKADRAELLLLAGQADDPQAFVRRLSIMESRLTEIGERRQMAARGGLVDEVFQDLPAELQRFLRRGERMPGRSEIPPGVANWARRVARRRFGQMLQGALLDPGKHNAMTLAAAERLTEAQQDFIKSEGELPAGVEFHHLLPVADFPEFAHLAEVGTALPTDVHRQAGHGGDPRRPVEAGTFVDPAAETRPAFHPDPEARKYHRARYQDIAEGRATRGDVDQDILIERRERMRELEARVRQNADPHLAEQLIQLRHEIEVIEQLMAREMGAASARRRSPQEAALRSQLVDAVPQNLRHHLEDVPILVVRADEFEAFTRSASGQAVTLIVHGRPVVVLKEGADPTLLREEGIHVLQSKDPNWAKRVGALDERRLAEWDRLPLEEQLALYRNKVEIEIDAQQRLLEGLESRRASDLGPDDAARLRQQIERANLALENLRRRHAEVRGMTDENKRAIAAGSELRPDWLDEPARLFAKRTPAGPRPGEVPKIKHLLREQGQEQRTVVQEKIDVLRQMLSEGEEEQFRRLLRELSEDLSIDRQTLINIIFMPEELRATWRGEEQLSPREQRELEVERYGMGQERKREFGQRVAEARRALRETEQQKDLERVLGDLADELNMDRSRLINKIFNDMIDWIIAERRSTEQPEYKGRRPATKELTDILRGRMRAAGIDFEGFILDSVVKDNTIAIENIRNRIKEVDPDAVLAVDRGGVFLADAVTHQDPDLEAIMHRVPKGEEGQRTPYLERTIRQLIEQEGKRKFVIVDFYMGGAASKELINMYRRILEDYPDLDLTFESIWMREEHGFERNSQDGMGLEPFKGTPEDLETRVTQTVETVRFVLGDDMNIIFNPNSRRAIVIFDRDGRVVQEIPVGTPDPQTGEPLETPRDILIRLLRGVRFPH